MVLFSKHSITSELTLFFLEISLSLGFLAIKIFLNTLLLFLFLPLTLLLFKLFFGSFPSSFPIIKALLFNFVLKIIELYEFLELGITVFLLKLCISLFFELLFVIVVE